MRSKSKKQKQQKVVARCSGRKKSTSSRLRDAAESSGNGGDIGGGGRKRAASVAAAALDDSGLYESEGSDDPAHEGGASEGLGRRKSKRQRKAKADLRAPKERPGAVCTAAPAAVHRRSRKGARRAGSGSVRRNDSEVDPRGGGTGSRGRRGHSRARAAAAPGSASAAAAASSAAVAAAGPGPQKLSARRAKTWQCPRCTLINAITADKCGVCALQKVIISVRVRVPVRRL